MIFSLLIICSAFFLQMSFLESNSNANNQTRLIGKEFKDPFSFTNERTTPNLSSSRNKWSTSEVDLKRRSYGRAHTDANNNINSHSNVCHNRKSFGGNRNSCTISFDELHGGKDEINAINENDKPILRLWAQKNKTNAAISAANRNSYLGSSNDSKKIMSQLSGTSWGKHMKNNNSINRMSNGVETINEETSRYTKSERASDDVSTATKKPTNLHRDSKLQIRPKSAHYERNLDKPLQKVPSVSMNTSINGTKPLPVISPKEKADDDYQEKTDLTKEKTSAVTENGEDSFIDELLDLEEELKRQFNDKPPPVPRRSSSRSSDLVGIFKKLNRDATTTTTTTTTNSYTRTTSCSTPTTAAVATITSTTKNLVSENNTKEREDPGCLSKGDIIFDSENDIRSEDIRLLHEEGKSKSITNHIIKSDVSIPYKNCQLTTDDNNNTQTHYDLNSSCSQIDKKTLDEIADNEMGERSSIDKKKTTPFNFSKKVRERKTRSSSANNDYVHNNFLAKQPVTQSAGFQRTRAATSVSSTIKDSRRKSVDGAKLIVSSRSNICLEESESTTSGIVTKSSKEVNKQDSPNNNCATVAKQLRRNEFIPTSTFEIKQVDINIEPDSVNTSEQNNKSLVKSYTDIESQITGVVVGQKLEKGQHDFVPDFEPKRKQTIEAHQNNQDVSLTPRSKSEVKIETKTNIVVSRSQQSSDAAENHKQTNSECKPDVNENILTNGHIEEMGSRYYNSTSRTSNSYYDRQHDSILKTSPMSTQLSRYNNERANISDKYFGKNRNLDSNDYSVHTNRYERSYSLNEDYTRPSHLTASSGRRTSVDSSDSLGSSYVPKSSYLRQRLLELKANEKDQPRIAKDKSFTSEDSCDITSYSNKSSSGIRRASLQRHEEKVDEFIRNFRERRSSYQSTPPYSPTLTVISSTYTGTSSNHNTLTSSFSNTEPSSTVSQEQSVFIFPSTIPENHNSIGPVLSQEVVTETVKDKQETIQEEEDKHFESTEPNCFDNENTPTSPLSPGKSDTMDSVFKRRGSLKNAVARKFSISSGDSKKNKEKEDEKLNDIHESPFNTPPMSTKNSEKDSKSEKSSSASASVTTTKNRFGKEKSTFGSITKITSSKISAASDLKSFSSRKKDKQKAENSKLFITYVQGNPYKTITSI